MRHKETMIEVLLSLFIPFYVLYWFLETGKGFRQTGVKTPSIKPLIWLLASLFASSILSFLPLLVLPLFAATSGESFSGLLAGSVLAFFLFGFVWFALFTAYIVTFIMYMINFSKAAHVATRPNVDLTGLTLVFLFIAPAGVYIVQDKINAILLARQVSSSK